MTLSLQTSILILKEHHLLKSSAVQDLVPMEFKSVSYDSRNVDVDSLFFIKGEKFRPTYLTTARENGAIAYVAEQPHIEGNGMHALIVRDVQKAMALLSAAFFNYPQDDLFVVGITGTKGKTTSSYFLKGILDQQNNNKTALFSTVDRIVGSKPEDTFKSDLTTPESLDLFRDMRRSVDNGMSHLVMEVSSQAYKKSRVFGLTYDLGIFLNITPDHIGANEHPNFDDYLHCKLQLLVNSRKVIINAETEHFDEIYLAAKTTTNPDSIFTYGRQNFDLNSCFYQKPISVQFENIEFDMAKSQFKVTTTQPELNISGDYQLSLIGDFNESNATAAIIAGNLVGVNQSKIAKGISTVQIPGRMQVLKLKNGANVIIDYAHNLASMRALLSFLKTEFNNPKMTVVVGSPGDKGVSRRKDFATALNEFASQVYLTTDDPGFENPKDIATEIDEQLNHDQLTIEVELDRKLAIKKAINASQTNEVIILAGKGNDAYQKVKGIDTPYETDQVIAKSVIEAQGFK